MDALTKAAPRPIANRRPRRTLLAAAGAAAVVAAGLAIPAQTASAADQSDAWVANSSGTTVTLVDGAGQQSVAVDGLLQPAGVAVTPDADLYVSDFKAGAVYRYPADGSPRTTVLTEPIATDLALDDDGNLYVNNWGGYRVTKVAPDGSTSVIDTKDIWLGDIAVDDAGNVYAPERTKGQLLRIAPDGTRSVIATGVSSSALAIALDAAGNIYLGGARSGVITRFGTDGSRTTLDTPGVGGIGDLTFSAAGDLYITTADALWKRTTAGTVSQVTTGLAAATGVAMIDSPVPAPFAVAPTISGSAPAATRYVAYSTTFTATGFPAPTFRVSAGTLPNGLALDATTGTLSGTPTRTGTFTFVVTASNGAGSPASTTVKLVVRR